MNEEILYNKDKFLITRPGIIELTAIRTNNMNSQNKSNEGPSLQKNAGFYCENGNKEKIFQIWKNMYVSSMNNSDRILMIPEWFSKSDLCIYTHLLKKAGVNDVNNKIDKYEIDPLFYIKMLEKFTENKKVLIIFPYEESFNNNIKKLNLIYPGNKINIDNILMVKTPQTYCEPYPHDNWLETYNELTKVIGGKNFDIALLSCGCYGHPLAEYVYSILNKSAFYIGGRLQLCFGIMGSRWAGRKEVVKRVNDHWTYPFKSETPANYKSIEYGCYWK